MVDVCVYTKNVHPMKLGCQWTSQQWKLIVRKFVEITSR